MKARHVVLFVFLVIWCLVPLSVSADAPGRNEDPFGGYPITGIVHDAVGAAARFGLSPFGYAWPGGVPSFKSGDGTTPRRAINISGLWAERSPDPEAGYQIELPNCATLAIPAGKARWFKLETYGDRRTQIWLDDEPNGATTATGYARFGAADRYMLGTAPGSAWQMNAFPGSAPQTPNFLEGFVMAIYGPESLGPMWAFSPPNAAILSVNTDERGLLLAGPDNVTVEQATGGGIVGFASHNPNIPQHLLWYEGRFHGWVFVLVYNQMIWDGFVSVCSQRVW
ncbi:MAG: hypothetical protein N2559_09890 [Anaerolineae bacterium]|nr:hypothetical protein [Anaerolineae bacterium]